MENLDPNKIDLTDDDKEKLDKLDAESKKPRPLQRLSFEEAKESILQEYDGVFRRLADTNERLQN